MVRSLHIRCGRYHILVHAEGVREVLDLSEDSCDHEEAHGCRLWRDNSIRVLDLSCIFEEPINPLATQVALVYGLSDDEPPVMLMCSQVVGLVQAEESSFRPLPTFEGSLGQYFDKILDTGKGQLLLRLRKEFGLGAVTE